MVNQYLLRNLKKKGIEPVTIPDVTEQDERDSRDALEEYLNSLPYGRRKKYHNAIEQCEALGDSYCTIDFMTFNKPQEVWDEHGYGLLFHEPYRNSIREELAV